MILAEILFWTYISGTAVPATPAQALHITLPDIPGATRFAVIGDGGTGGEPQYEVARVMDKVHDSFPFTFVLMAGDNLYGGDSPDDYRRKFEEPYRNLLEKGVRFYASLGNHDSPNQRFYRNFNMKGERYYTIREGPVRFFALDSTYMDQKQLTWLEKELRDSSEAWKICFFHHPIYSSGKRHGSDLALRKVLEPLFVQYGVAAVFSGHDHIYERTRPQKGITYFVSGAAGQLRRNNIRPAEITAKGFADDRCFMTAEVAGDKFYFQVISRLGETVDSGTIEKAAAGATEQAKSAAAR
jgi:3',5'-cyclic AMP phosphodiesterase CpdA